MMQFSIHHETGEESKTEGPYLKSMKDTIVKKKSSVSHMVATEQHVYVLYSNSSFEILNAENIEEVVKSVGNMGDIVSFALSANKKEIWACDKKGFIQIFSSEDLSKIDAGKEIKTVYGHPGLSMGSSNDGGSMIVVGDVKGYTTVFDTASREQKFY